MTINTLVGYLLFIYTDNHTLSDICFEERSDFYTIGAREKT
jgi:hypothetical protein